MRPRRGAEMETAASRHGMWPLTDRGDRKDAGIDGDTERGQA